MGTVEVENAGLTGEKNQIVETALEAVQGFTIVLCDLKTYLGTGRSGHLTRDKAVLIAEAPIP